MGAITILKNTVGHMTPEVDFIDTGWSISGGVATHNACNDGIMTHLGDLGLIIGHTYEVTFDVLNFVWGGVYVSLGTANGPIQNSNGTWTQNITCTGNTTLSFFGDGQLSIDNLVIYDLAATQAPITFAFNERHKIWSHNQPFVPDTMLKYGDNFFSFNNGVLYKHNDNQTRGNFYGVQYSPQITFYLNSDPGTVKIPQGIVIESNKKWWCPTISIKPYTGKSLGMLSRLKPNRINPLQGVFYGDFMRNMLDPTQPNQLAALFYGEELRGRVMAITIQNDDTDEVLLYKVQVKYAPQMLTP